ncbi:uncharacterized protein LOC106152055 [Lingula anatina]|uniref:Uncharacterized protein LOC106152055 n=1 Tax=Lingula anatina TaxID=7574 RepID=A0A1S3H676_LINAN|nr:uncharacterized protein LOC106152055 [Lingula anatina]|eukprot:XP_013380981.1 uncharacterized protein LOC106152055 [Lingula anatina]
MARPQPKLDANHTKGRFNSCVAVITGGASGINRACVSRFLNDGASVAFFDIDQDAGKQLESELKAEGLDAAYYQVDVSNRDACSKALVDIADKHGGSINYVINGAACFIFKGMDASSSDWEKTLTVNVVGYANMVQACHPYMKKAEPGCRAVVNIASITGHIPKRNRWTYDASKGAVLQLTRCMALDLAKDGIRVNSVSPAVINTPSAERIQMNFTEAQREWSAGCHMMNRQGESSEVAAAIAFLCSRDASFITGADLPVDGGYTVIGPERHGKDGPDFSGNIPD